MRRLPKDEPTVAIRLDYPTSGRDELDKAAVVGAGLSAASFARLALELLVQHGRVTMADVRAEADRRLAGPDAPAVKPKRPRGRPRKGP